MSLNLRLSYVFMIPCLITQRASLAPSFWSVKMDSEYVTAGVRLGHAAALLRHCTTNWKVVGSIPDGVTGIHWHNPSGRTMALGSTQHLAEMSTRNISWGVKAAGAYGWQIYHLHVATVLKSGNLKLLEPSGPVQACNGTPLPFLRCLIIRRQGLKK
jgi:hypothetical protein